MTPTMAVLQGIVKPDGTLELDGKISLPAGPVQVTVVPMPALPKDDPYWQRMQAIWAGHKARGHVSSRSRQCHDCDDQGCAFGSSTAKPSSAAAAFRARSAQTNTSGGRPAATRAACNSNAAANWTAS
jgi:hypothetical protein